MISARVARRAGLAAAVLPAMFACSLAGAPSVAQAADGRILYQRAGASRYYPEAWVVDGNGRSPRRLVPRAALPALSPDGKRLTYYPSRTRGNVLADGQGRNPRPAPNLGCCERAWSPDSKRLAIADRFSDLHVVNADGTRRRRLLRVQGTEPSTRHPSWAPNGGSIAVQVRGLSGTVGVNAVDTADIWVARSDGIGARNFTNTPPTVREVACPPEEEMLCTGIRDGVKVKTECVPGGANETKPIWTPAGIVVERTVCVPITVPCFLRPEVSCTAVDFRASLTLLGSNGQPVRDLISDVSPTGVCAGVLSPDRRKIAVGYRGGLYVISVAGGPPRRLPAGACPLSWAR